jgi:hypothetical protein
MQESLAHLGEDYARLRLHHVIARVTRAPEADIREWIASVDALMTQKIRAAIAHCEKEQAAQHALRPLSLSEHPQALPGASP